MPVAEHYHLVQAFPSNRADQPLHIGILPGTLEPADHLLHVQRPQSTAKLFPVDLVPVTNDISLTLAFPERLYHLLTRPFCRRMLRDAEMQHSSAPMFHHQKHEQHPSPDRRTREEVNRYRLSHVVPQKGSPVLRRPPWNTSQ